MCCVSFQFRTNSSNKLYSEQPPNEAKKEVKGVVEDEKKHD